MRGLVIRNTGSFYTVKTDDGKYLDCKIKGTFRLKNIHSTNPIAVGDRVIIDSSDVETPFIIEIEDRKNYMIRKASNLSHQSHIIAANLDQAILVVTVNYPVTTSIFIDRFLVTAEAYRIPAILVFNKIDRYKGEDVALMNTWKNLYTSIGYKCICCSAAKGVGIEEITAQIQDKTTLFSGHSGVGKSSLINRLIPGLNLKTGEISEYHNRGVHTTTFSEMLELPHGGYIIDTPGIKGFGTLWMEDEEVSHYFPELFALSSKCRFNNCTHRHEPGCEVLKALKEARITESRYHSYLSILNDRIEDKYREAF